jgi:RHS repeat-associated protein
MQNTKSLVYSASYFMLAKFFLIALPLIGFNQANAQYANYSNSWNYQVFLANTVGGGGNLSVGISNNTLTVQFNGGFSSSPLKQGQIVQLNTSPQLPDMAVGLIPSAGGSTVSIINGYLTINGPNVSIASISHTFTLDISTLNLTNWLVSPNGSENFSVGNTIPVTVNSALYNPGNVGVELYKGSTRVYPVSGSPVLTTSVPTVGLQNGSNYKLRIVTLNQYGVIREDWSNAEFSLCSNLTAGTIGYDHSICIGSVPSQTVNSQNPSGGNSVYQYQWEQSANGTTWTNAGGNSAAATYAPSSLSSNMYFRKKVASCGNSLYTNSILITVNTPSVGGTISQPAEAYGFASGTLLLSGYTGTIEKWQQKSGSGVWTDIVNTATSHTYSNISSTTYFRAVIKNGTCAAVFSQEAAVMVYQVPTLIIQGSGSIAPGGEVLIATESLYYSYKWYKDNELITGDTYAFNVKKPGTYKVLVKASATSGESVSNEITINGSLSNLSTSVNAIVATQYTIPGVTNTTDTYDLLPSDYNIMVNYFDGLGRSVQSVILGGSASGYDFIQPILYDKLGREGKKFMPYVSNSREGIYQPSALINQSTFYANTTDKVVDDLSPFSQTVFESSPLNRIIKKGSPGSAWQPDATNSYTSTDHTMKFDYEFNSLSEVLFWTYTYPTASYPMGFVNASTGITALYYPANTLYKNKSKDEQQNELIDYKDKEGRIILKKVQAPNGEWAETYYIYDDFGSLVVVIPPEAVKAIKKTPTSDYFNQSDAVKEAFLKRWAFRYAYDSRRRMTIKQVPGADPVYMVYDTRDRLVLTQDANQRAGATNAIKYWTFTKYDELNRPILTGIKDTTTSVQLTQAQMQAAVDAHYAKAWTKYGETYVGNAAGNVHGYSNKSYPVFTTAGTLDVNKYLTVAYYDNYSFKSLWPGSYNYVDENLSETVNTVTYNQPDAAFVFVKGLVTGTKVKVLDGGSNWLKSITYYDDDYRAVQTIADNQTGGTDLTTTLYDFTGKPLETKTTHRALWRDRIGVSVSANTITRTLAGSGWGTAGAASVRALPASTNGYIELTVNDVTNTRMIGFALANENTDYKTIDFIVYLNQSTIYAYERDINRGSKGTIATGDVIRLDRTGTSMKIYKNGTAIYTFPTASSTALYADCSLNSTGSALTGISLSWAPETHTVTRRFNYDHAQRLINTWHTLDSGPEILITKNVYNELGQLIDKKLHSTLADGSDAKQSVDYRYNIRGWMTKINESDLTSSTESGEARDLFGMELGYNTDIGISNTQLYNGNISGIKWSNNLSLGTVTENAYTYTYDAMNRLKTSAYKQKESTWAVASNSGFAETGFNYDLNGNILNLQRNDSRASGWMDNLTYNYGTGATQSNKLLSVTDAGDDFKGFIEGTNGAGTNDYTYDANGNMISDLNKGILTGLPITYNYLNLPETVSKGTSTIRYTYDATGRKLSQTVSVTGPQKQTDYIGEYVYTNGTLQFVGHEEGRIVLASEEKVFSFDGSHQTGVSKTGADVTLMNETTNGETYLKASITAGAIKRGIKALTTAIPVTAGERYVFRVRGYRGGEAAALYVKGNSTDLVWPGASLPNNNNIEAWVETYFTIPVGVTQIETGVLLNTTISATQVYYINAAELIKLSSNAPEYQYNLKDHLGNVRMTFTTKQQTETYTATFETGSATAEDADFSPSYDNVTFSSAAVYASSGTRSQRLSASPTEMVGLSKSLSVMPGDTIDMKVYAKYFTPTNTNSTVSTSTLVAAIASGFGLSPTSTGEALKAYTSLNQMFTAGGMMIGPGEWEDDNAPKAYLNFILFDKDFIPYDMGWDQIGIEALENGTDVDHDTLELSAVVREPGYIYIYLSNENNKIVDVYFDDLMIEHHLGPVVQQGDYYAFGLNFNSYQRENSTVNNFLYNGKEKQDELDLGWMDYGARMFDASIGRWMTTDPLSCLSRRWSPYTYAYDNPIRFVDPDGMYSTEEWKKDHGVTDDDLITVYQAEPDQDKPEKKENSVGIAAYGKKSKDKNAFEQRKEGFGATKSYTVHTGDAFIDKLVKASEDGPITRLIVGSHGSGGALYMDDDAGLYTDTFDKITNTWFQSEEGAATLQELAEKIESGDIKFAEGAQIFFVGCNTADNPSGDSFAEVFSKIAPNAYVTGSTNQSSPSPNSDGKTDSNNYSSKGNSAWLTYHNGVLVRSKNGTVDPTKNTFK